LLATTANPNIVFCQIVPGNSIDRQPTSSATAGPLCLTRLLANLGVATAAPVLARFNTPEDTAKSEKRWLDGMYLDQPEEWDDPYRFFRW
jgi:hypothetical protein